MNFEQIKKASAYVWSFGKNQMGELGIGHYKNAMMAERVRGLPPKVKVTNISSGGNHTGVVTDDGKLWICGSNIHDKLGLEGITTGSKKTFKPVELMSTHRVIQVACGDYHTLCLTDLGKIYVWGGSLHKKRGDKSEDRKGQPNYQPSLIRSLESKFIIRIECGDFHSLALEDNGSVYSWGTS